MQYVSLAIIPHFLIIIIMLIQVLDNNMRVGHPFKCRLSFVNPLPARLANCVLTVEGPGLDAEEQFNLR